MLTTVGVSSMTRGFLRGLKQLKYTLGLAVSLRKVEEKNMLAKLMPVLKNLFSSLKHFRAMTFSCVLNT